MFMFTNCLTILTVTCLIKEYSVNSEHLQIDLFAKSKTKAVKLVGLVLSHGNNFVKFLSTNGYAYVLSHTESV